MGERTLRMGGTAKREWIFVELVDSPKSRHNTQACR